MKDWQWVILMILAIINFDMLIRLGRALYQILEILQK